MAIVDIVQLAFNGIAAGLFTYFCVDVQSSEFHFYVNKVTGGIMNCCWVMYCVFAHLLAFNRFCNVFYQPIIDHIFSQARTNIALGAVWLYGIGWLIAYMTPNFNLLYYVKDYNWDYDVVPLSRKAWMAELLSDTINTLGMIMWYACILIRIHIKMSSIHQNPGISVQDKKESKVLLQAMLLCLMIILTLIGFFLVPIIMTNRWMNFASNLFWLMCAGNNSLIYIFLNSTIKRKFQSLLEFKNPFANRISAADSGSKIVQDKH